MRRLTLPEIFIVATASVVLFLIGTALIGSAVDEIARYETERHVQHQ